MIQTAIEEQVQAKAFNKNNEAVVELVLPADHTARTHLSARDFATEFFIISDLNLTEGAEVAATAAKTPHPMCPRCRRYEPAGDAGLCERCEGVLSTVAS